MFDTMSLLEAQLDGPQAFIDTFRDQLQGSVGDFDSLTVFQKQAIANAAGLSVVEVRNLMNAEQMTEEQKEQAKEREKKAAEMRTKAFRKAVEKAFKSQFNKDAQGNIVGPADRSKMDTASFEQDLDRAKSMQRMTADQVVNQAFEEQNAPTPDQLAATVENPDEEIEAPTANGRILKKYVKKLNQHQPDFNFDEFYEEVDVYLKDRSEDLFPKSGRDYVFGDEHWKAFVVVRNLKDKKQAVSESYKFLGNLVKEIKQKW